ncbi:MAG: MATE family efflux transporter [Oscillospiraceae bacterium]|nr:MATE family efflux transporter [Oscillospiraceae bacterium]
MRLAGHRKVDFCTGSIPAAFIRFTIPVILSSLLHMLFNTADMVVVGKFVGDAAQAAVSSTGNIVNTMICLLTGLGAGVSVLTARCIGSKDEEKISRVVHTAIATALLFGSAMAAVSIVTVPWVLEWMDYPPEISREAVIYLRIYFVGLPIQLFYQFGANVLQAQGDSSRPMYYLTIGGVVNLVGNLVMVLAFGMGVEGVAIATVMSYVVSAWLVGRCLTAETESIRLELRQLRIHWPTLGRIASIGIPAGLQSMMFSLSGVILQSSLNSLGTVTVAGVGAGTNLIQYVNMVGNSANAGCITFAAQNLGADQPQRIKQGYRRILLIVMGVAAVVSAVLLCLSPWLLRIYTNDPAVVQQGLTHIRTMVPFHVLHAFMQVTQGFQRGLGASVAPMLVSVIGTCGLRALWAGWVFPLWPVLSVLIAVYPVTWLVTGLVQCLHLWYYFPRAVARAKAEKS